MTATSGRETTAARLLRSSAARSYDPEVDVNWEAPEDPGLAFLPEHRISLYGTELWARMTPEQRRELGRHEILSITSFGIYVEVALMHLLLKVATMGDPTSSHAQYALTEVADECRHSTMFGKAIRHFGVAPYRARLRYRLLIDLAGALPIGPATYAGTLLVEELLDRLQRESMADASIQPTIRMINRIHVLEEARHIAFARAEVRRMVPLLGAVPLAINRVGLAALVPLIIRQMIKPDVYAAVGLDPKAAAAAARSNPRHHETLRWMGERLVAFLRDAGMIEGRLTTALWRRSHLLGQPPYSPRTGAGT